MEQLPVFPVWLELAAVALGAITASAAAEEIQRNNKRIDWLGVGILGVASGLGGGIMRDLLMGVPPATIQHNWYVLSAVSAALVGMLLSHLLKRFDLAVSLLDAASLGFWAVVGTSKALSHGMDPLPSIMIGTVAAAGGSAVRDLLLQVPVGVLYAGTFYAAAAFTGVSAFVVLDLFGVHHVIGMVVCFVLTFLIRMASVLWGLSLPEQMALQFPAGRRRRENRALRRWRRRGGGTVTRSIPVISRLSKRGPNRKPNTDRDKNIGGDTPQGAATDG